MAEISKEKQIEILSLVRDTFDNYIKLSGDYRERMIDIYDNYISFRQKKLADWSTTFKVNKAFEVVNKILPRIVANNPRWIVTPRTDEFVPNDKFLKGEAKEKRMEQINKMAQGVQDYLTYIFDQYNLVEKLRLWAKNMLIYGNSYAKVNYKYEVSSYYEDEFDGTTKKRVLKENVVGEYPTIDVKSWTDIYVDPRYVLLEDMPAIVETVNGVRMYELKQNDKLFNLDKLEKIPDISTFQNDKDGYKNQIYTITGIQMEEGSEGIDKNSLNLKVFYGLLENEQGIETRYKVTTVEDLLMIGYEEIPGNPFEDIKAFEDTETHFASGFVEPMAQLQEEMNFKKNSASEYINNALNRSRVWSPFSGVDPRSLVSKPGNIISTDKDAQTALANLIELPHREIPSSYFAEQNDIERQIQGLTFTVDTSNPRNDQALTNTATGIRVKFFESNSVINEVRKHFEEGMQRLAYKLLAITYENMEDNIVIKKMGDEKYWEINKELLKDALNRYTIKVEVNSSSFDSIESRRQDAIAFYNILAQAASQGVPVDLKEGLMEIINTFEKKSPERFIKETELGLDSIAGGGNLPEEEITKNKAAELTEQVAKGGITEGL